MKFIILGSGTIEPSLTRSAPAYLLEVGGRLILLDSGDGAKRRIVESGHRPVDIDYFLYTKVYIVIYLYCFN